MPVLDPDRRLLRAILKIPFFAEDKLRPLLLIHAKVQILPLLLYPIQRRSIRRHRSPQHHVNPHESTMSIRGLPQTRQALRISHNFAPIGTCIMGITCLRRDRESTSSDHNPTQNREPTPPTALSHSSTDTASRSFVPPLVSPPASSPPGSTTSSSTRAPSSPRETSP